MNDLGMAIYLAAGVHQGQTDKAGTEYILHPLAVMAEVERRTGGDRDTMIVAVLHDAIEDFDGTKLEKMSFIDALRQGFSPDVLHSINLLTHARGVEYMEYIELVATDYKARIVKIADLTHNMDPRRIPASEIVDKDFARWEKYRRALIRLERD
jgi:(p)ppGpp synthase/HD superfamily hydrolase